jgi:hypothetical protein
MMSLPKRYRAVGHTLQLQMLRRNMELGDSAALWHKRHEFRSRVPSICHSVSEPVKSAPWRTIS